MRKINEFILEKLHIDKDTKKQTKDLYDCSQWEVGDIIVSRYSSSTIWIHFYELVRRTEKMFELKKLKEKIVKGDGQRGESVALPGQYDEREKENIKARLNKWGSVAIDKYTRCFLWNGEPVAFDHMD